MPEMIYFEKNIKIFRSLKGLTQEQMAAQVGVSLGVWKTIELEKKAPELIMLEKLSKITGVDPENLLKKELTKDDFVTDYKEKYEKALDKILELKEKLAFSSVKESNDNNSVGAGVGHQEINKAEKVVINPTENAKEGAADIEKHLLTILDQVDKIQQNLEAVLKDKVSPAAKKTIKKAATKIEKKIKG